MLRCKALRLRIKRRRDRVVGSARRVPTYDLLARAFCRSGLSFSDLARRRPGVLVCHRVTGEVSFVAQAALRDVRHLEELINHLEQASLITTLVVVSARVERGAINVSKWRNAPLTVRRP